MENYSESIKIMLIVYGLAALISMLMAAVIKLIFAGIRRGKTSTAAKIDTAATTTLKPEKSEPGKAD